ncbi:TPA: tape measure protein [Serratia marcescens]|uniref:tape measure protein n=1 Tax=Serratia marcescens TaxID=615 RepID=UPI001C41DEC9|nr:tape measure protein [Serratia marcescens]EGT0502888.1 tape measure protein [Serratia marcescens]MDP8630531.1 tape measure protein [Serratia marcescens]MDP8763662.1 tape measure protein [Serratia marcescens]HBH7056223.1 tape measure protein [Serratia marcescens]HED1520929.1 tape measure protein [Serratia marcescens]
MTEENKDLVTKVSVDPDLSGIKAFQKEIDAATRKVEKLDRAIRNANNLKPQSPYAPAGVSRAGGPAAGGVAAGAAAGGLGAHLINRGLPPPPPPRPPAGGFTPPIPLGNNGGNHGLPPPQSPQFNPMPQMPDIVRPGASQGWAAQQRKPSIGDLDFSNIDWGDGGKKARKEPKPPKMPGGGKHLIDPSTMLAGAASAYAMAAGLSSIADSMDKIQQQESQLERLPQTIGSGRDALLELNQAANDVRTDGEAFISTYTNMATATEKLKLSQEDVTKATQGLVGALQLGGGSSQAVSNALYQMGQAFSSDRFGGDEFRSFMEAIGTQAPKVAEAFGTDVKGLREMSEQGKLTAEVMVKAFSKMSGDVVSQLNKQGWTWGQVVTVMKNDWNSFLTKATSGGEWKKLTGWLVDNVMPAFKKTTDAAAEFWLTTTDESKKNMLLGILAAIGAGFLALAVPVLAATWPFLAVGAAVWFLMEAFSDFKAWMDGKGGNIFDSMFGSFDEFERRYPKIVTALKTITEAIDKINNFVSKGEGMGQMLKDALSPGGVMLRAQGVKTSAGTDIKAESLAVMDTVELLFGLFSGGNNKAEPSIPLSKDNTSTATVSKAVNVNDNSVWSPNINVNNVDEANAIIQNSRKMYDFNGGNMAATAGAE